MNGVHGNGFIKLGQRSSPARRLAPLLLLIGGIALLSFAVIPWLLKSDSPAFAAELQLGDFGYYNDERNMLQEYAAPDKLLALPSIEADRNFIRPDGSSVLLQVPKQVQGVKAIWAPKPGIIVGTIAMVPFQKFRELPRENAEMTIVVTCRAVCWDERGRMYFLDSFLKDELLKDTRLLFVWKIERDEIYVGGTFPLASKLTQPSKTVIDEAKLREIGLTNAQVIMGPKGYRLTLTRN